MNKRPRIPGILIGPNLGSLGQLLAVDSAAGLPTTGRGGSLFAWGNIRVSSPVIFPFFPDILFVSVLAPSLSSFDGCARFVPQDAGTPTDSGQKLGATTVYRPKG